MSIQQLVEKLEKIILMEDLNDNDEMDYYLTDSELENKISKEVLDLIHSISSLASSVLITEHGKPLFAAHQLLRDKGFPVTAGEVDDFGWLSAIIHTKKGKIVYW